MTIPSSITAETPPGKRSSCVHYDPYVRCTVLKIMKLTIIIKIMKLTIIIKIIKLTIIITTHAHTSVNIRQTRYWCVYKVRLIALLAGY